MGKAPRSGERLLCPVICAAITLALFWPLFAHGRLPIPIDSVAGQWEPWRSIWQGRARPHNPQIADAVLAMLPYRTFAVQALEEGRLPLWNPLISCGAPFWANSQSAVLHPVNWLVGLPPLSLQALAVVLQVPLAFCAMWAFLRGRRLSRPAAAIGALSFALGGAAVVWLEWTTIVLTVALLPLILWAVDHGFHGKRWGWAAGAVLLGADAYMGHLQYAAFVSAVVVAYGLARSLSNRKRLPAFLAMLAIAGALAAPQMLPSVELARSAHRHPPPASGLANPVPGPYLLSFVAPNMFGNPVDRDFIVLGEDTPLGGVNYNEVTAYVGLLTLVLAIWGVAHGGRAAWFFATVAVLGVWAACGGMPAGLLAAVFPPLRTLYVSRALVVAAFALSVLGAMGMEAARSIDRRKYGRILLPAAAGLLVAMGAALWGADVQHWARIAGPSRILWRATALGGAALLLAGFVYLRAWRHHLVWVWPCLLAIDLLSFGFRFNSYVSPATAREFYAPLAAAETVPQDGYRVASAPDSLPPDVGMLMGLPFAEGYDSLNLERYVQVWQIANRRPVWGNRLKAEDLESAVWALLAVRHVLFSPPSQPGALAVRERTDVLPRAFVVRSVPADKPELIADLARKPREAPAQRDLLAKVGLMPSAEDIAPGHAQVVSYESERVTVEVRTESPGWLVLSDAYFPGWRAYVLRTRQPVQPAYHAFRAVKVEGDCRVDFVYWPASFAVGLFLAGIGVAIGVGALATRRSEGVQWRG